MEETIQNYGSNNVILKDIYNYGTISIESRTYSDILKWIEYSFNKKEENELEAFISVCQDPDLKEKVKKTLEFLKFRKKYNNLLLEDSADKETIDKYDIFLKKYENECLFNENDVNEVIKCKNKIENEKNKINNYLQNNSIGKKIFAFNKSFLKNTNFIAFFICLFISYSFSFFIYLISPNDKINNDYKTLYTLMSNGKSKYWETKFYGKDSSGIATENEAYFVKNDNSKIFRLRFYQYRNFIYNIFIHDNVQPYTYKWYRNLFVFQFNLFEEHSKDNKYKNNFFSSLVFCFLMDTSSVIDEYFLIPFTFFWFFFSFYLFLRGILSKHKLFYEGIQLVYPKEKTIRCINIFFNSNVILTAIIGSFIITAWNTAYTSIVSEVSSIGVAVDLFIFTLSFTTGIYFIFTVMSIIKQVKELKNTDDISLNSTTNNNKYIKILGSISLIISFLICIYALYKCHLTDCYQGSSDTIIDYSVHIQRIIRYFITVYGFLFIILLISIIKFGVISTNFKINLSNFEETKDTINKKIFDDKFELRLIDYILLFLLFVIFSFGQAAIPIIDYVNNQKEVFNIVLYIGFIIVIILIFYPLISLLNIKLQNKKVFKYILILILTLFAVLILSFIDRFSRIIYEKFFLFVSLFIIISFLIIIPSLVYINFIHYQNRCFHFWLEEEKCRLINAKNEINENSYRRFDDLLNSSQNRLFILLNRGSFIILFITLFVLILMYIILPIAHFHF